MTEAVDYQVRVARITDVDRFVVLSDGLAGSAGEGPLAAADLLRQLVYIPQASVLVAEGRQGMVGGLVLALRPSVRAGGYVGTVDLLVVDQSQDVDRITGLLLDEALASAQKKGCAVVEAARPEDPDELARWERHGFVMAGPLIERSVSAVRATGRAR
jgi:hypothetical protein